MVPEKVEPGPKSNRSLCENQKELKQEPGQKLDQNQRELKAKPGRELGQNQKDNGQSGPFIMARSRPGRTTKQLQSRI